ncbi:MAG: flagellar biosynthetic protein FliR [Fibrobacterota bacterium]
MQTVADVTVDQLLCFLMAFVRITSMIAVLPILGSRGTPVTVKLGLSVILTMILFPLLAVRVLEIPTGLFSFSVLVAKELFIGITMGFAASLIFAILQYGSYIMDQEMSFTFAETFDPMTETSTTPIAQLNAVIFSVMFLILGGHRLLIMAMANAFEIIPLGSVRFNAGPIAWQMTRMTGAIFNVGLAFAAPVVVTLIITTAVLGIIARTAPQLNIFIVGLPLRIGLGFLLIVTCLPQFFAFFEGMVQTMNRDIHMLLRLMA